MVRVWSFNWVWSIIWLYFHFLSFPLPTHFPAMVSWHWRIPNNDLKHGVTIIKKPSTTPTKPPPHLPCAPFQRSVSAIYSQWTVKHGPSRYISGTLCTKFMNLKNQEKSYAQRIKMMIHLLLNVSFSTYSGTIWEVWGRVWWPPCGNRGQKGTEWGGGIGKQRHGMGRKMERHRGGWKTERHWGDRKWKGMEGTENGEAWRGAENREVWSGVWWRTWYAGGFQQMCATQEHMSLPLNMVMVTGWRRVPGDVCHTRAHILAVERGEVLRWFVMLVFLTRVCCVYIFGQVPFCMLYMDISLYSRHSKLPISGKLLLR